MYVQQVLKLTPITAYLICGLVFLYYASSCFSLYIRRRRAERLFRSLPAIKYPHRDPIWGSDLLRLRKSALKDGRLKLLYLEHHRKYGETWQEIADGGVRINTISTANLQYIYALHMSAFRKGNDSSVASMALLGKGILTAEGNEWRWNRRLITPTFSRRDGGMPMNLFKGHVDRFIENLPRDGMKFDIQERFKKLFLDVSTHFLFGEAVGMQLPSKHQETEIFLRTLDSTLLGMNKRRQGFNFTSIKLWFDKSYVADVARVHEFIDARVKTVLERTSLQDGSKGSYSAEPHRYVLADEMARQIRDPEYLRSTLLQCFLPARDQPAILLSNTMFELARNPEHWSRLRTIACTISAKDELSIKTLTSLRPIQHAVFEAMRLHGPGGGIRRTTAQDIVFPEGGGPDGKSPLFVAKGTQILSHLPVLHRSKLHWGEDADEYRPQRFEETGLWGELGWIYKPFLAGPRTCPAKDQTVLQSTYIMLRLLKEYETIENKDEVLRFVEMARLTTESRRGAKIALIPS